MVKSKNVNKKRGSAAKYLTRTQSLRKLQLKLNEFRRLCILKGIFPKEPPKFFKGVNKTYYLKKDINFLANEKLLNKFREIKAYQKKIKKAQMKSKKYEANRLIENKPTYTLTHIIKERYPRFIDALQDIDDALCLIGIFANLPKYDLLKISSEKVNMSKRLLREFYLYSSINKNIEIKGDLEDDFVLLANGGELPVELITDQEKENLEKNKNKINNKQDNVPNLNDNKNQNTYKYITKEEIEYVQKKFLMDENEENISGKKKGNFIGKKEFNEAINEILNSKKGKNEKNKIETVMGLKKSILDEEEFEEYELSEEDEDLLNDKQYKEKEKEKNNINKNLDNKKLKNLISNKKEENEEDYEEEEEEEEEEKEEDYQPNIKIEYVNREDEPAPFDKDDKLKKKRKNKKEFKNSRTKQYEQMKANGELSDESFDKEKLDELLHDEEFIKKTKELIDSNIDEEKNIIEVDKEIETKYNIEPKVQKDITMTSDKIVNLPKTIKQEKREKNFSKKEKDDENSENKEEKEENKINSNNFVDKERKKETKEDKALRKKLLKMERKERRAEKKKLKNAFKEEKVSQQRQIAQANKIVRYGLSIKDI